LYCDDVKYIKKIQEFVLSILGIQNEIDKGYVNFFIESQDKIPIEKSFKDIYFSNNNLKTVVCNFMTSDIYVGTGSSLTSVLAYSSQNSPIIIEEKRKNIKKSSDGLIYPLQNSHFFSEGESILLYDGIPILSEIEIHNYVRSVLTAKNKSLRTMHDSSLFL